MFGNFYDLIVALLLGSWLALSIFVQRRPNPLSKFDALGLLPNCRFFAPRPIAYDFGIVSRTLDCQRKASSWRPLIAAPKRAWCFLWNPGHRLRKTASDLTKLLRMQQPQQRHLSHPYLQILSAATEAYRGDVGAVAVQFAIVRSKGFEDGTQTIIFISHPHPIEPR